MKFIWIIKQGIWFDEHFWILISCKTKKQAEKICREEGYKWSSYQDLFLVDDGKFRYWRKLEKVPFRNNK